MFLSVLSIILYLDHTHTPGYYKTGKELNTELLQIFYYPSYT